MRTPEEIRLIVRTAERSCTCDGGNTNCCAACVAERAARAFTVAERHIAQGYINFLHGLRNRRSRPRMSDYSRMVESVTRKPRWIMHKEYAHVAGYPCAECDRRNAPVIEPVSDATGFSEEKQ